MRKFFLSILIPLSIISLNGCAVGAALGFDVDSEKDTRTPEEIVQDRQLDQSRHYFPVGDAEGQENADAQIARQMRLQAALENREVTLGMVMRDVRQIMGDPASVEVAGIPGSGNERWVYFDGISTLSNSRVLYFEQGRVAGWETKELH